MYLPFTSADGFTVLGHYAIAQLSGAIIATPTALDPHASFRWAPSNPAALAAILRIKVGWATITAVTIAVRMAYQASIARGFIVDFTTGNTQASLATKPKTGAMRSSMAGSLLGTLGPQIVTTTVLGGQTYTLDANPVAMTNWSVPSILTGTVSFPAGVSGNMQTLYERTADGQYPITLANNEGVVVQLVHTGWGSGTVSLICQWEWAEILQL